MHNAYKSGRNVKYLMAAHVVLTTKYRRRIITDAVREMLVSSIEETATRLQVEVVAIDGTSDHLHLLVHYHPSLAISKFVAAAKTNSSRTILISGLPEVRKCLYKRQFWSSSYFVVSAGGAPLEVIKRYVDNQRGA